MPWENDQAKGRPLNCRLSHIVGVGVCVPRRALLPFLWPSGTCFLGACRKNPVLMRLNVVDGSLCSLVNRGGILYRCNGMTLLRPRLFAFLMPLG